MRARTLIKFYDSSAKKIRQKGDIFDVTPARFNEITLKGRYIEAHNEPAKATAVEPADKK